MTPDPIRARLAAVDSWADVLALKAALTAVLDRTAPDGWIHNVIAIALTPEPAAAVLRPAPGPDAPAGSRVRVLTRAAGLPVPDPAVGVVLPPGYCRQEILDNPKSESARRVIAVQIDGDRSVDATSWEPEANPHRYMPRPSAVRQRTTGTGCWRLIDRREDAADRDWSTRCGQPTDASVHAVLPVEDNQ